MRTQPPVSAPIIVRDDLRINTRTDLKKKFGESHGYHSQGSVPGANR